MRVGTTGGDSNGGKEKEEGKRGEAGAAPPRTLFNLPCARDRKSPEQKVGMSAAADGK